MGGGFLRDGDLKNIASYPLWLQEVVIETGELKSRVVNHPLFAALRDCQLGEREMCAIGLLVLERLKALSVEAPELLRVAVKRADVCDLHRVDVLP